MATEEWIDPRLTVFLIWGVCVTVFLCYPSKNLVFSFCHRLGFPCCEDAARSERSSATPSSDINEVDYEFLSEERKQEIDGLRSIALLRYLSHFSMTIKKDDMLRRSSLSKLHFNESGPQCRDGQNQMPDVERGVDPPGINEIIDTEELETIGIDECDEESRRYTHVMIPCPGHGVGLSPIVLPKSAKNEKDLSRRRIFVGRKGQGKSEPENDTDSMDGGRNDPQITTEKRDVPVHCAICLMEFDVSERLCWASNPECTHVFHEDCIVNWLIHLGRVKSKTQRYSESPMADEQLLNYNLACPCCRQDFVLQEAVAEIDGCESV